MVIRMPLAVAAGMVLVAAINVKAGAVVAAPGMRAITVMSMRMKAAVAVVMVLFKTRCRRKCVRRPTRSR